MVINWSQEVSGQMRAFPTKVTDMCTPPDCRITDQDSINFVSIYEFVPYPKVYGGL